MFPKDIMWKSVKDPHSVKFIPPLLRKVKCLKHFQCLALSNG